MSALDEIARAARKAVGEQPTTDWSLDPNLHAGRLAAPAAARLGRLLEREAVKEHIDGFLEADAKAAQGQAAYRKHARLAIFSTTVAALAGSLVLFFARPEGTAPDPAHSGWLTPYTQTIGWVFLVVQVVAAAITAAATYLLQNEELFREWMKWRGRSESHRQALFDTVLAYTDADAGPVTDGELPLTPLQLEYFLRYQFDLQRNFYKGRGEQHAAAARRVLRVGGLLAFLGVLFAGLTGNLGANLGGALQIVALCGIALPLLVTMNGNLSSLGQDRTNSLRYDLTRARLDDLRSHLDGLRLAAAAGKRDEVLAFAKRVNDILAAEHSQWSKLFPDALAILKSSSGAKEQPAPGAPREPGPEEPGAPVKPAADGT